MGVDKAELQLGGQTLLEIAVKKLKELCSEVVVVGERERVPRGVRVIPDLVPGCGPVGGMAAALADLKIGDALFLPVDMPLIPGDLLRRVAAAWGKTGSRVSYMVAEGRAQPLVSQLSGDLREEFAQAVARGEYRIRELLDRFGAISGGALRTEVSTAGDRGEVWPGWMPDDETWRLRSMWFANLNTPEEFAAVERLQKGERLGGDEAAGASGAGGRIEARSRDDDG